GRGTGTGSDGRDGVRLGQRGAVPGEYLHRVVPCGRDRLGRGGGAVLVEHELDRVGARHVDVRACPRRLTGERGLHGDGGGRQVGARHGEVERLGHRDGLALDGYDAREL